MVTGLAPVYFADENTLGLGKLLRRSGREDVLYPGHEGLPDVRWGPLTWTGCQWSARRG